MGKIQNKAAHVQRSSSMSYAMLGKFGNKRLIIIAALLITFACALFYVVSQSIATKHVTVVLNGQETIMETRESTLENFLVEQSIDVNKHDRISMPIHAMLQSGDRITIDHVTPIRLKADGETNIVYTTGKTVQAALQDLNISVGEEDRIVPAVNTEIAENSEIEIIRVQKIVEEHVEVTPFAVITQKDKSIMKGKEKIVQEGKDGIVRTKVEKVLENNVVVSEQIIDEVTETKRMDRIVAVGTMNPVVILSASSPDLHTISLDGFSFGAKQILKNVTLTAYDAGLNSTGKTEEHPQYGMTYTGTIVEEGRTAAVDPKVIPLGWWIYIENIGLRRAEDIGSAIKGKKVDIYMESEAEANKFGRQHGHVVYIVGPKKPETE